MLDNKTILITGGTGSFGQAFVATTLSRYAPKKLIVYSRDELKQLEMQQAFPHPAMRFFIGDVRDKERLERALEGVDIVIHAAALKQVPTAEYNPFECIKTNVLGAQNVIDACLTAGVHRVIALSTDKAAAPINLYGATKLCSDKMFIAAHNMAGARDIRFSVVRYGNVLGSRGSVIPYFLSKRHEGSLPITHPAMTRFSISLAQGVELVLHALQSARGGEIFVPKIPSYRITDLARAIAPQAEQRIIGIRPGEKIHEEMITETDAISTIETDRHYVIVPNRAFRSFEQNLEIYQQAHQGRPVPEGFRYSSGDNTQWLSVEDIRRLIREEVDPGFSV
ncbi:MAG: UDP-N-acetylglucosamine 4,6-dehydratase (inverting) [Rhodocyclaceae bacterium]|jgi:UDP-N-acetylglucosamine 4,6-dehydratase (inverting)|nr:UDP-N-acetylglucosamine 4,6-dehydratase (inverting) [Rhodocyclaceae bacterium]